MVEQSNLSDNDVLAKLPVILENLKGSFEEYTQGIKSCFTSNNASDSADFKSLRN
jgi:hypothetical protein